MAKQKGKPLDVGILLGIPEKGKHKEPDADQQGGPSDEDEDNLPMGALEAYREHAAAEKEGNDAAACAALGRMVRAFMEPPEAEEAEGEEEEEY